MPNVTISPELWQDNGSEIELRTTRDLRLDSDLVINGGDIKPTSDSTTAINIAQADGTDFVTFDTTNKRVGLGVTPSYPLDVAAATGLTRGINATLTSNANGCAAIYGTLSDTAVTADGGFSRAGIVADYTANPATTSNRDGHGLLGIARTAIGGSVDTGTIYGLRFTAQNRGTATATALIGVYAYPYSDSTGTTTTATGIRSSIWIIGGGTYTTWNGILIDKQTVTGTVTNLRGIAMNDYTDGTNNTLIGIGTLTTGNYAFYINSTKNSYFAGNIGIGITSPTSLLQVGTATTKSAPTTTGAWLGIPAATLTDSSTASSGTAATGTFSAFGIPVYAASNTSVTVTDAANVYIAGAPTAGTNVTLTNAYALWVDDGLTRLDGSAKIGGYLRVGSTTTPTNTTAGDVTLTRLAVNSNSAFSVSVGKVFQLVTNLDDTSAGSKYASRVFVTVDPASDHAAGASGTDLQGMHFELSTPNTVSSTINICKGFEMLNRWNGSGNATSLIGGLLEIRKGSGETQNYGTITNAIGLQARGWNSFTNTASGTVTNSYASYYTAPGISGTQTIGTSYGAFFENMGLAAVTTSIGIKITAQANATNNTNFLIGTVTTGNWSIYNNSTSTNWFGGKLGIGASSFTPTNMLSLSGQVAQTIWSERHATANTAGNTLTIQAGGATSAATDKNGGDLILAPGLSTGTGVAQLRVQGPTKGTTGTADNTLVNRIIVNGTINLTSGAASTIATITAATLQGGGGHVVYSVFATDGTDVIEASGQVAFAVANKGGTYTLNTSVLGTEAQAITGVGDSITNTWGTSATNTVQVTSTIVGMTPTTFQIIYTVVANSRQAITAP